LQQIVDLAFVTEEGSDVTCISLRAADSVFTPAFSAPLAFEIDQLQYAAREGPCLDAISKEPTVYAEDLAEDQRWPVFGPQAAARGMRSLLWCRLSANGTRGALNLYAALPRAYGAIDRTKALIFAAHAGIELGAAEAREDAALSLDVGLHRIDDLIAALGPREIIGVAASARDLGAGTVEPFVADTTSPNDLKALVRFVVERFGRLDYAVNNAGISGRGRIEELDKEFVERVLSVNHGGVFWALQLAELLASRGSQVLSVPGDLTEPETVGQLFDAAVERFGGIDIVIANAGRSGANKPVADITDEEYDGLQAVNNRAVFMVLREASRRIRDGGHIINISSSSTAYPQAGYAMYAASKVSSNMIVRILAAELGPRDITSNSLIVGPIAAGFLSGDGAFDADGDVLDRLAKSSPAGRLGTPDDVAAVAAFLARPEASWDQRSTADRQRRSHDLTKYRNGWKVSFVVGLSDWLVRSTASARASAARSEAPSALSGSYARADTSNMPRGGPSRDVGRSC
jgi:3-oxoacyl-[acyl-carrier protein] reductase